MGWIKLHTLKISKKWRRKKAIGKIVHIISLCIPPPSRNGLGTIQSRTQLQLKPPWPRGLQCIIWTPLQSFWGLESFWALLQCTVRSYWWDGTRDNTGALPCWGPEVAIIWGPACPPGPNMPFILDRIPVSETGAGWYRADWWVAS